MKYKAIGFDHGGVIEGRPGFEFNNMVCSTLHISLEEYETAYFAHNRDTVNGHPISEQDLWKRVLQKLGKPELINQLLEAIGTYKNSNKITNDQLLAYISKLREHGFKTGLLSNNSVEVAQRLRSIGQDAYFDSFIISAEVGMTKPDPKIFELLIKQLGVKMSELIFIDDSEKSLSTAETCGFTPILYTTFDNLIAELKNLGIDII